MASGAAGHKAIRLQELAIPCSIASTTAALIDGYIPKSSQLTISSRASGGYPSAVLDRTKGATATGGKASPSMPAV